MVSTSAAAVGQSEKHSTLAQAFSNLTYELAQVSLEQARTQRCCVLLSLVFGGMILSRFIMIPVLAQMILYTIPIIWFGSHLALNMRVDAEENEDKRNHGGETLSRGEAMAFPFLASGAILGLYLAFKFLPPYWVNLILSVHVTAAGWYSVGNTAAECWKIMFPLNCELGPKLTIHFHPLLHKLCGNELTLHMTNANIMGYIIGAAIAFGWLATRAWLLHNLFAIGFCVQAIRLISVGSFKTASMLLIGLFFYDIFWVFKTDVMVTVAKTFDAPAKLLFPTKGGKHSLLGLGDIVIPGIFTAMTLRFDYWRKSQYSVKDDQVKVESDWRPMFRSFNKFYFIASMVAYAGSLILTGCIMLMYQSAQPALLYLVPALLLALYVPAIFRRELSLVNSYSEEQGEDEERTEDEAEEEGPQTKKDL